ncbi:MAG TPA: RsmE family RNA methyltransferase [Thermoanaerobaculia bacterium]|jgi:16S rRNA (uracil1498-N3)-methyltransferase|nr:RsmE family RNA methyltransferase [Thermoanaerobaculia bacterium]
MITLLVDPAVFGLPEVKVEGDSYRHLFRARRVEAGEALRVVDGRGRARWGTVARVDRTSATVALGEPAPAAEPAFRLELLVPTCRLERASWLVEKATELGVHGIHFLNTTRAPRELTEGSLDRLRRVAIAALEQCHGSRLPEITGPHPWREIARLVAHLTGAAVSNRWFLDTEAADSGWGEVEGDAGALLVGPEGGWDPGERHDLLTAGWRPVHLGDRVLRLETAALAGAALLLFPRV